MRTLSKRQQKYRDFLKSDFWAEISKNQKHLFPSCADCGETENLQAHHEKYPKDWYQTKLSDLVTLCNFCHRARHRLWTRIPLDDLEAKMRSEINHGRKPSRDNWFELKDEADTEYGAQIYAGVLFHYCMMLRKNPKIVFAVRNRILRQFKQWSHL